MWVGTQHVVVCTILLQIDERKTSDQIDKTFLQKWIDHNRKHIYSYKSHTNQQFRHFSVQWERDDKVYNVTSHSSFNSLQILNFGMFCSKFLMVHPLLTNALLYKPVLLSIFCPCSSHYKISTLYCSITSISCTEHPLQADDIQFSTMHSKAAH
jgi:hypothetical protein